MEKSEIEKLAEKSKLLNTHDSVLSNIRVPGDALAVAKSSILSEQSGALAALRKTIGSDSTLGGIAETLRNATSATNTAFSNGVIGQLTTPVSNIFENGVTNNLFKPLSPSLLQLHSIANSLEIPSAPELGASVIDTEHFFVPSPVASLQHTLKKDAEEKRRRDEEQTELLRQMVTTARTAVEAAERGEAQAKHEARLSRATAVRANVFALLALLLAMLMGIDQIAKWFEWLFQKLS